MFRIILVGVAGNYSCNFFAALKMKLTVVILKQESLYLVVQ